MPVRIVAFYKNFLLITYNGIKFKHPHIQVELVTKSKINICICISFGLTIGLI